jgi:hypothetical protein
MPLTLERGALDAEVINEAGRIDLQVLARVLDLSVPELAAIVHASPRTVNKNPDAKSLQPAAQRLVRFMNDLTTALGERRFAIYWLNTPQRELKDETPLTWMRKGRLDEVADYVAAFIRMQPD